MHCSALNKKMVKKGAKSKKLNKLESLKAAIEEEENKSEENEVVEDQPKLVKKRKGKFFHVRKLFTDKTRFCSKFFTCFYPFDINLTTFCL